MIGTLIRRTRRNHALEHATIALLSRRHPHVQVVGLSGPRGFMLFTNLSLPEVFPAVNDALELLQAGHTSLAIHEQCGTNLVAAAALTTAVTALGLRRQRERGLWARIEGFLNLVTLNAVALLLARPLGSWVQSNLTVDTRVEEMEIAYIRSEGRSDTRHIRVYTQQP